MRLSIVIPSYNQCQFIGQTLESILRQSDGLDLEVIIVDGQSTDNSVGVANKYRPLFEKKSISFTLISEPDKGQSDAINKGSRLASGELLTYLNSDDYYEPNCLNQMMAAFEKHPMAQWGYGGWNFIDLEGRVYSSKIPNKYIRQKLFYWDNIMQPSCFYRKDFFIKTGLINEALHLSMDYDLWLRMALQSDPLTIPVIISNARYYMLTKSATKTMNHLFESFVLQKKYSNGFRMRCMQYFYLLRGILVILLGYDISVRIERKRKKLMENSFLKP